MTVIDRVLERELELGVVGATRPNRALVYEPFLDDRIILAVPAGPPLRRPHLGLDELVAEPLIVMQAGAGVRTVIEEELRRAGRAAARPAVAMELGLQESARRPSRPATASPSCRRWRSSGSCGWARWPRPRSTGIDPVREFSTVRPAHARPQPAGRGVPASAETGQAGFAPGGDEAVSQGHRVEGAHDMLPTSRRRGRSCPSRGCASGHARPGRPAVRGLRVRSDSRPHSRPWPLHGADAPSRATSRAAGWRQGMHDLADPPSDGYKWSLRRVTLLQAVADGGGLFCQQPGVVRVSGVVAAVEPVGVARPAGRDAEDAALGDVLVRIGAASAWRSAAPAGSAR